MQMPKMEQSQNQTYFWVIITKGLALLFLYLGGWCAFQLATRGSLDLNHKCILLVTGLLEVITGVAYLITKIRGPQEFFLSNKTFFLLLSLIGVTTLSSLFYLHLGEEIALKVTLRSGENLFAVIFFLFGRRHYQSRRIGTGIMNAL